MRAFGLSDPGCVREQNQDAYRIEFFDRRNLLCVVCDGMGGAKSGNIASALAIDVFTQEITSTRKPGMSDEQIGQMLKAAVREANFSVYDQAMQFSDFEGMGTTLVAAYFEGSRAFIVNVGDSRAYLMNQNGIGRITMDHSLVQVMLQRGELTPDEARHYPGKNLITRAIGTEKFVECDLFRIQVERGDSILMCTDGLSNLVDEQEMLFEVVHGMNKDQCCARLLEIAKSRGAPDNVTSILVLL